MAEQEDVNKGLIGLPAGQIPNAFNPRGWTTDNFYVKGSPQTFGSLADLIKFHPFKMGAGMSATVINHPAIGNVSDFRLVIEPNLLVDDSKESTVTLENYELAWELVEIVQSTAVTVYMYSADGPAGGAPIYPYVISEEHNWLPVFDANKGHRWMRFRSDNIDVNADDIFDNWTQPIRVSDSYTSGDYVENRFKRQAVDDTIYINTAPIGLDKSYGINVGSVTKDIGGKITKYTLGFIFLYTVANGEIWDFTSCEIQESLPPPPRTIDGIPNNDPSADGWIDSIPTASTDQLWQIWAQKSVYGQLKSDWRIKRVNENPSLIRYSNSASPHPDTIVGPNTPATDGSQGDIDLKAKGWEYTYLNHVFMATREVVIEDTQWTAWTLQKIDEESGEYTDNVFKLFDLNLDTDDPAIEPPIGRNALAEGWSDTPVLEPADGTQVNYISTCRKFFDGTLKTPWSTPIPYTGQDSWTDTITSDTGDDFKYNGDKTVVIPAQIVLTSKLYKGLAKMWASNTITYVWEIVFNNGGNGLPAGTEAGLIGASPLFYYSLGNGLPVGDPDRRQDGQIVTILPDAVDGKAVIKCTQLIEISPTNKLEFVEEFSILDITDGNDAKNLVLNTDTYVIAWDDPTTSLAPSKIGLRAYQSNLVNQTWKWWIDVGNTGNSNGWIELLGTTPGYSINGTVLDFDTDVTNVHWTQDNSKEANRYAITNYNGSPDTPSSDPALEQFRDIVTITKLAGGGGVDGTSPISIILTNEAHTIVLDTTTGAPQANQSGINSPSSTKVMFYEGTLLRNYNANLGANEWVITSITETALDQDGTAVNLDVVGGFSGINGQTEAQVYVSSWISSNFPAFVTISAQLTINISYNGKAYSKIFTLGSSLDAPGAIILDIDSDKGFVFDVKDRSNKILTATIHDDTNRVSTGDFFFNWFIEGNWTGYLPSPNRTITNTNIRNNADVIVTASTNSATANGDGFRKRTVRFTDVLDGKQYIFWNASTSLTAPARPIGNGRDNSQLGTWYRNDHSNWNTNIPKWASDGQEVSSGTINFTWSAPYKIGGEEGTQGENGGFEMSMYQRKANGAAIPTLPASPRTIASMKTSSWSASVPTPLAETTIYVTRRFYKGEYQGDVVKFNSSNEPVWGTVEDTSDTINPQLVLGDWSPVKSLIITPATPLDGVGTPGIEGWSPSFGAKVITSTKTALQLKDWVGGTDVANKPGYIDYYVGITGLTTSSLSAVNIKGADGVDGVDGKADWYAGGSVREKLNPSNVNVTAGVDLHNSSNLIITNTKSYTRIAYVHSTGYTYNSNQTHYIRFLANDVEKAKGLAISLSGKYSNWAVSGMLVIPANTSYRIKIVCNITVAAFSGRTHYEILDI